MKAPDPKTRIGDDYQFLGSYPRGQELIAYATNLSQKLSFLLKKKVSETEWASFVSDELLSTAVESNVLAVLVRILKRIQELREKDPQFLSHAISHALNEASSHTHAPLATYYQELIDLVFHFAFPKGEEDLVLPVSGFIANMVRPKIWKMISESIRKECYLYFQEFISVHSREALFSRLLFKLEHVMHGGKISFKVKPQGTVSKDLEQAIATFFTRYMKSISPTLFKIREEDILFVSYPIAQRIAACIVTLCDEDFLFDLLEAQWEGTALDKTEREIINMIAVISRDSKGLLRLITEASLESAPKALESKQLESELDIIQMVLSESAKSYSIELFASSVVDKLQADDWLERFLGAWFLSVRSEAHAQLILEIIRNILRHLR